MVSGSRPKGCRRRSHHAGGSSRTASIGAPGMRGGIREAFCDAVWMVRMLVAPALPGVTEADENVPLAPAGRPVTLSDTAPVKVPPSEEIWMLKFAAPPGLTACVAGVAASVKVAGLVPVPLNATLWGEPLALSAMLIAAVNVPVAVGVNVTETVQVALTASVAPQVVVSA